MSFFLPVFDFHDWLRHYATSRKVEGSISDEGTGIFN
jgi:hypothetical protein